MRILLLGSTGNLGSRLVPALLSHSHTVTVLVRSPTKLSSILPEDLYSHPNLAVEVGDATDSSRVEAVLEMHDIEGIMDTAGNQVLPWQEFQLEKIAKAVVDAAVRVGKKRGAPLRAWFIGGLGLMDIPGTQGKVQVQDYFPRFARNQHQGTYGVLTATPTTSLRWSILCVSIMSPLTPAVPTKTSLAFSSISPPPSHDILAVADSLPGWPPILSSGWRYYVSKIPLIGYLIVLIFSATIQYHTKLEEVADLLAENFERDPSGGDWVGKRVAMIERRRLGERKKDD